MRVAAIYDVHGNLPALEAVLDDIRRMRVDRLVVGGDLVPGPMVAESLTRLDRVDVPVSWIRGNCESALLAVRDGRPVSLPGSVRDQFQQLAAGLSPEALRRFDTWPITATLTLEGVGEVLFCHGTPRDDNEIFTRETPDDRVRPMFAGVTAPVVVCGHTHMQFDRQLGRVRILNAGSVGMPFGDPGAYWLMFEDGRASFQQTPYDLDAAAARLIDAGGPDAQEFVDRYLRHPPTEAQMLEIFNRPV